MIPIFPFILRSSASGIKVELFSDGAADAVLDCGVTRGRKDAMEEFEPGKVSWLVEVEVALAALDFLAKDACELVDVADFKTGVFLLVFSPLLLSCRTGRLAAFTAAAIESKACRSEKPAPSASS